MEKQDTPTMAMVGLQKLGIALLWTLRLILGIAAFTLKVAAVGAHKLHSAFRKEQPAEPPKSTWDIPVQREITVAQTKQESGSKDEIVAADRIIAIRLNPAVAVLHLRLYYDKKVIKREMIVTEPRLRGLLEGRRHTLPDAVYSVEAGLADIKEETVKLAQELINRKGNLKVKPQPVKKPETAVKPQQSKAAEMPTKQVEKQVAPVPLKSLAPSKPVAVTPQHAVQKESAAERYVPRPAVGVKFEGVLVRAGSQTFRPRGRAPYETFEARIQMDGGVEVPLTGAELERELERCGVAIGDKVAITPMGKVPVTLADGQEGSKNMYRVDRLNGGN